MSEEPAVRMAPPPAALLRVLNPVFRRLLRSRLADRMPAAMAVLEFTGRRSARPFAVPVGVHDVPGGPVVFAEGRWAVNFEGGREVTLVRGRTRRHGRGTRVHDPGAVATALGVALARVGARNLAMKAAPGRRVTHDDLLRLGRGMVRLDLD